MKIKTVLLCSSFVLFQSIVLCDIINNSESNQPNADSLGEYEVSVVKYHFTELLKPMQSSFIYQFTIDSSNPNVTKECKEELSMTIFCVQKAFNQSGGNSYERDQSTQEPALKRVKLKFISKQQFIPLLDASRNTQPGILVERTLFSGLYSECAAIDMNIPDRGHHLKGGYGRLFFDAHFRDKNVSELGAENYKLLAYDVCLPKSCSNDVDLLTLGRLILVNGSQPVQMILSIESQSRETDYKTWMTVCVLILIGIVSIVGTIYDYFFRLRYTDTKIGKSKIMQCCVAFSIYANVVHIFSTENANKPNQIGALHFVRFASFIWILIGQVCAISPYIMANPKDVLESLKYRSTQILTNAYFAADTFFFLSGLLVSFVWFKEYNRNKRRQMSRTAWTMFYVHRFIRLTPPYYLTIAFYSFVFLTFTEHMPYLPLPDPCETNWWINFLYLNNYIDYGNQCYSVSWYLATDLQMYIFAPILLVPLAVKPVAGLIVAGVILCASTAANMATIYELYFPPTPFEYGAMDPRMENYKQYTLLIAEAPWIRCQIYIIGMLIGYLLQKKKNLHINKVVNVILWMVSLAIGAYIVVSLKDWANGELLSLTERAFYSAFTKIAWGLALSYITVSCFYGYGGPINQFMSWSVWIPLSRLTYCSFLLHQCILQYFVGMSSVPFTYTNFSFTFVSIVLPTAVLTYFFAIFWSALFEVSAEKIEMLFLGEIQSRRQESTSSFDSEESETMNDHEFSLPQPPSHAPPIPPRSQPPQERTHELANAKTSLYKLFKRNTYKSYKPPQQGDSSCRSNRNERSEVFNVENDLQNQAMGNVENRAAARRGRKQHRDLVTRPAIDDWN